AAGNFSARPAEPVPVRRPADPGGQEYEIGIIRVDDHGVGIVGVRRHRIFSPRLARVVARHHADDSIGHDYPLRSRRVKQNAMNVALNRIGIDLELAEACSEVRRYQQRADLNADPETLALDHDILHMPDARRRRKAPPRNACDLAQAGKLAPAVAAVLADEDMGRKRSDAHDLATLQPPGARRPQVDAINPVISPGPGESPILAAGDADPMGGRKQRAVIKRGHGADRAPGERPMRDGPGSAGTLEEHDPVYRSNKNCIGALRAAMLVGTTVRQQDHRALPSKRRGPERTACGEQPQAGQSRLLRFSLPDFFLPSPRSFSSSSM